MGRTRKRIIEMGRNTLFCSRCGLEAPLDVEMQPCAACHNVVFVPLKYIDWSVALTEEDKAFLRTQKIAIT